MWQLTHVESMFYFELKVVGVTADISWRTMLALGISLLSSLLQVQNGCTGEEVGQRLGRSFFSATCNYKLKSSEHAGVHLCEATLTFHRMIVMPVPTQASGSPLRGKRIPLQRLIVDQRSKTSYHTGRSYPSM